MKKAPNEKPGHLWRPPPPPSPPPPQLKVTAENRAELNIVKTDRQIVELGLKIVTKGLDDLLTACMSESGPTRQGIARARGLLPAGYVNSFKPKQRDTGES